MKQSLFVIPICIFLAGTMEVVHALDIDVSSNLTDAVVPSTTFQAAGKFTVPSIESSTLGTTSLSISDTGSLIPQTVNNCGDSTMTWYVEAYIDPPSGEGYSVRVNRASSGSFALGANIATGSPSGFINLSTSRSLLFCGVGNVSNIILEYQIYNFQITGGSGDVSSTVHYEVKGNT